MTAPDAPREAEVRALLERHLREMELAVDSARLLRVDDALWRENAALYRAALALLDAGREDRERADRYERAILWALGEGDSDFGASLNGRWAGDGGTPRIGRYWWRTELRRRAAIDQARGA